jgi:hypothetical protein
LIISADTSTAPGLVMISSTTGMPSLAAFALPEAIGSRPNSVSE